MADYSPGTMTKLSAVQVRVLKTMLDHDTTVMLMKHSGSCFFRGLLGKPSGQDVRASTMFVLLREGLVENVRPPDKQWLGSDYTLTPAGREVAKKRHRALR